MWCSPAAATGQAIQADPDWPEAASRNALSSPADPLLRSRRALASCAGWADSEAQAARKAAAARGILSRRRIAQSSRERSELIETGPLTVESRTTGEPDSPSSTTLESSVQFFRASSQDLARHWNGERP